MAGKFEVKKSKDQYMFNLKASNGQVVLTSERYKSKAALQNGISAVKQNAKSSKNFERRVAKNGKPYFVLLAKNGQVVGRSEMYASTSGCASGIKSVMRNARNSKTEDIS